MDYKEKVIKLIGEHLVISNLETIKLKSRFVEDLGADSLDLVELVMTLEDEFHIAIEDSDVEKMLTVEDICKYIEKRINNVS